MSKLIRRNAIRNVVSSFFIVTLLAVTGVVINVDVVQAQSDGAAKKPARKTKRVQTIGQENAKKFEKVAELFEANKNSEAKAILDQLSAKADLNNFEKAYIGNFLGGYYFERDDLNSALREFKKVIKTPEGIPEGFYSQTFYVIAQVYFSKEDYKNALDYAQRWFKTTDDPPADAYMLLGQAHYMLKNYNEALPNVQKGIQKYIDVGSIPKEGWLNLLSSIYRQKNDYKKMLPVVKQLVQHYPKKTYLMTMGGIYNEMDQQSKMTAMYQAMYDQGLMASESEVVTLASLQLSQDNPFKGATIIEKGMKDGVVKKTMKNYRLLAQSLMMAKEYEKALGPLEQAAKLAKDGDLYNQLGQSYVALSRYPEAESAFGKAFNKGKLKNSGQTYLSLGMSQFEQKKFDRAKSSFQKAMRQEKSAKAASQWIKYVDAEVYRIKELNKPVAAINTDIKL